MFSNLGIFFKNKKGISPLITVILLIVVTVIIVGLIMSWSKSYSQDTLAKLNSHVKLASELECNNVSLEISNLKINKITKEISFLLNNNSTIDLSNITISFQGKTYEGKETKFVGVLVASVPAGSVQKISTVDINFEYIKQEDLLFYIDPYNIDLVTINSATCPKKYYNISEFNIYDPLEENLIGHWMLSEDSIIYGPEIIIDQNFNEFTGDLNNIDFTSWDTKETDGSSIWNYDSGSKLTVLEKSSKMYYISLLQSFPSVLTSNKNYLFSSTVKTDQETTGAVWPTIRGGLTGGYEQVRLYTDVNSLDGWKTYSKKFVSNGGGDRIQLESGLVSSWDVPYNVWYKNISLREILLEDSSRNNNHSSIFGSSFLDNELILDGINDYLVIPDINNDYDLTSEITLSFIINPSSLEGNINVISREKGVAGDINGFSIEIQNQKIAVLINGGFGSGATQICNDILVTDKYYQIVWSRNEDNVNKIFINGVECSDYDVEITHLQKSVDANLIVAPLFNIDNIAPYQDYSNKTYDYVYNANSWGGDYATIIYYAYGGFENLPYKKLIKTASGTGGSYSDEYKYFSIGANRRYIVSSWLKANKFQTFNAYILALNRYSDNIYRTAYPYTFEVSTSWKRYFWEYNSESDHVGDDYLSRQIIYIDEDLPLDIYWSGFQVEDVTDKTQTEPSIGFQGVISNINIYNKALNENEIKILYEYTK